MDKEKLKLIIRNLKLLVDSLESEVHADDLGVNPIPESVEYSTPIHDYDEIFEDD